MAFKFHTPSWHSGGKKFKVGYWLRFRGDGSLKFRTGWREHGRDRYDHVYDPGFNSVVSLLGSNNSARKVFDSSPGRSLGNGYR